MAETYQGKACSRCGGTLRYRRNRNCVPCHRRYPHKWRPAPDLSASGLNTLYALYYEADFDRDGCRHVCTGHSR